MFRFAAPRALGVPALLPCLLVLAARPPGVAAASPPALDGDQLLPRWPSTLERFRDGRVVVGDEAKGLLALTFDDGPSAKTTLGILDELDRRGVSATFFINAYRLGGSSPVAARQRELLAEELARGHAIGNHTFDHRRLSELAPAAQEQEILAGERGIERVIGERPWLFRPPYGRMAPPAAKLLRQRGYTTVLWNISAEDAFLRTPERVLEQVLVDLRRAEGGVVLFHDTHEWTARALPRFFDALAAENCRRAGDGRTILLLVPLDRFIRPRYGERPAVEKSPMVEQGEPAERAHEDHLARERIAAACSAAAATAGPEARPAAPTPETTPEKSPR